MAFGSAAVPRQVEPDRVAADACSRSRSRPSMSTPAPVLPEIVFALPIAGPPMTLLTAPNTWTPVPLPIAAVPAAFVPIRFPVTKFPMLVLVRALHHDAGFRGCRRSCSR